MNVALSPAEETLRSLGQRVGLAIPDAVPASHVIRTVADAGMLAGLTVPGAVIALDAMAAEAASAAMVVALHAACMLSVDDASLLSGARVGALTLATDEIPVEAEGALSGRASWVAPLTENGLALVGARSGNELIAWAIDLGVSGVAVEAVNVAGLPGLVIGHVRLNATAVRRVGPTMPVMARARLFVSAVGLGIARRAVREALVSARGTSQGAGGEQTTQGLVADSATELDAAMMLTWKAASEPLTLGSTSMAKLAATVAAQRAVERATQIIGAESFRQGHIIERLARDVRALELFAGRTEALREAVALES